MLESVTLDFNIYLNDNILVNLVIGISMSDKVIDGFSFTDAHDVNLAQEEVSRIKYIASRMNMDNPRAVLAVYDKLISSGIFVTPVGIEYLRTLQNYLYKCNDINDEDVRDIPVAISYSDAMDDRSKERDRKMEAVKSSRTLRKTFRVEYKVSLIVNVVLFIGIIAMFIITLKADNPNMINYRTAILNQYSDWQQELSEREQAIKEKEIYYKRLESGLIDNDSTDANSDEVEE